MKNILILLSLIFCYQAMSCSSFISLEGAQVAIDNAQKNLNNPLPSDWNKGLLCYDGIEWGAAEIIDNVVDDLTKPIKRKSQSIECVKECIEEDIIDTVKNVFCTECQKALESLDCEEKYINEDFTESYCVELVGYEQKIDGKKLINSEAKLTQLTQKRNAEKQAEKQKEELERRKKEAQDVFFDELIRNDSGQFLTKEEIRQLTRDAVKAKKENARLKD